MGLQLVFCVEADKKSKSDFIYIKNAIDSFYEIDQANIRISPVFMGGKGNYNSKSVIKWITEWKKQYQAGAKKNKSVVIYCLDCDEFDRKPEDRVFLQGVKEYCKTHDYHLIWFCRDIEDVFLGERIPDNQKKRRAEEFARKKSTNVLKQAFFMADQYQIGRSNLCVVLDEYLSRKTPIREPSPDRQNRRT